MNFSNYLENKIIDHCLRAQAWTPPANLYLALFSNSTGLEGNSPSAEISANAYARQPISLTAAVGGVSYNTATISFPRATANWGQVSHIAIVDHLSNTNWGVDVNVLVWAKLDSARTIQNTDTFRVMGSDLSVVVD